VSRRMRGALCAVIAAALVLATAAPAMARPSAASHRHGRGHGSDVSLAFTVSKPAVAGRTVTVGVPFDASGTVSPAIAAGDTSTSVIVQVFGPCRRGRASLVATVPAVLSGPDANGNTVYDASVAIASEGEYSLVTVAVQNDVVVGRSKAREVRAVLPYTVSRPRVEKKAVVQGMPFDATGTISPGIPVGDPSFAVAILVFQEGKHGAGSQVATVDGSFTGPDADGNTGYTASVTLPSAGEYQLVAVVTQNGAIVGRSGAREMVAKLPFKVSGPHVASWMQTTDTPFDATGSISPALAPDDTSTTVAVQVFKLGWRHASVLANTVTGSFTGLDADGNTGYTASITITDPGAYALVTVLTRDGIVIGRSCPRLVFVSGSQPAPFAPGNVMRRR
jgi:hypothetical protein